MKLRRSDLDKFFDKAGCDRVGPQRTATKLWARIQPHLSEQETRHVLTAWGHATEAEHSRAELDTVRAKILKRMAAA